MKYKQFTQRQEELLETGKLNMSQSMILLYIYDMFKLSAKNKSRYTDESGNLYCVLPDNVLSQKLGVSERTIARARKGLVDNGIINHKVKTFFTAEGFKASGTIYILCDKELLKELGL